MMAGAYTLQPVSTTYEGVGLTVHILEFSVKPSTSLVSKSLDPSCGEELLATASKRFAS